LFWFWVYFIYNYLWFDFWYIFIQNYRYIILCSIFIDWAHNRKTFTTDKILKPFDCEMSKPLYATISTQNYDFIPEQPILSAFLFVFYCSDKRNRKLLAKQMQASFIWLKCEKVQRSVKNYNGWCCQNYLALFDSYISYNETYKSKFEFYILYYEKWKWVWFNDFGWPLCSNLQSRLTEFNLIFSYS
jgi:hypothetical protein